MSKDNKLELDNIIMRELKYQLGLSNMFNPGSSLSYESFLKHQQGLPKTNFTTDSVEMQATEAGGSGDEQKMPPISNPFEMFPCMAGFTDCVFNECDDISEGTIRIHLNIRDMGYSIDDISLECCHGFLTITGEHTTKPYSRFIREYLLPNITGPVELSKAMSSMGLLNITVSKIICAESSSNKKNEKQELDETASATEGNVSSDNND